MKPIITTNTHSLNPWQILALRHFIVLCFIAAGGLALGRAHAEPVHPRIIAAQVSPAVVSIATYDEWDDEINTGTGFLVDDKGTFVTNHHVIEDAVRLSVELSTGERFDNVYSFISDEERDIAILRIPAERTPAVSLGVDLDLAAGDTVFVMGNPLGLARTFSNGMVSARRMIDGSEMIQISAPISSGSSGGPVMDERGQVVGVATWTFLDGQNLNMAIPIRYVRSLLAMQHTPTLFVGNPAPTVIDIAHQVDQPLRKLAARIDPSSDDPSAQQIIAQLAETESVSIASGYVRSHEPVIGKLNDWQNSVISIKFESGRNYLIAAVCDKDCVDLDIFLHDAQKKLLIKLL